MRPSVQVVHDLVGALEPGDDVEAEHRADTLRWIETTDDIFRRSKPATPARHLVAYVVLVDPDDGSVLLVDHLNARLWLPPGGHVEPDEHPADAARRQAHEELAVDARFVDPNARPLLLTVRRTAGVDAGHVDVSLWFHLIGRRGMALTIDEREFREARWWSPAEVEAANVEIFDPHHARFMAKISGSGDIGAGRTGLSSVPRRDGWGQPQGRTS